MTETLNGVELKKYDILVVKRYNFSNYGYVFEHRAMFIGDGVVVHFTAANSIPTCAHYYLMKFYSGPMHSPDLPGFAYRSNLYKFIDGDEWVIDNDAEIAKQKGLIRLPDHEIDNNVKNALESHLPYCLFKYNCDHFVTHMKYGRGFSLQTDLSLNILMVIAIIMIFVSKAYENNQQSLYRNYRDKWGRLMIRMRRGKSKAFK